jgi:hypothetical protein
LIVDRSPWLLRLQSDRRRRGWRRRVRLPSASVLYLFGGWSFLHLHRAEEATKTFQKAENLPGEEKSSADPLAGEAAATWASGANENAVGASQTDKYRQTVG